MRVIGINGSPRENSNTQFYIHTVLEELDNKGFETEEIRIKDMDISGCTGCYSCIETKKCVIEDDFHIVFDKMIQADGILLGSPVYHSSITPKLKALLDRAGFSGRWSDNEMKDKSDTYDWKGTAFSGKVVSPITVARRAGHCFTFAQLLLWATVNDCIVVSSNYWNVGVAGKGGNVDAKEDQEAIGIMKHLAENMDYVIKQLKK